MQLSVTSILELQQQGNLKKFATFMYLKQLYKNSCIFNYNINSLSTKSGLSRNKIRSNIKYFISKGWCTIHSGNLVFTKWDSRVKGQWIIRDKNRFSGKSIKEITTILLSIILKQKNSQFNYIQEIKSDLEKSKSTKFIALADYKKAIKAKSRYSIKPGESENFKMSIKSISKLFNVSMSSVSTMIGQMQRMALVTVIGYYPERLAYATKKAITSIEDVSGIFVHSNTIWKKKCNDYIFS